MLLPLFLGGLTCANRLGSFNPITKTVRLSVNNTLTKNMSAVSSTPRETTFFLGNGTKIEKEEFLNNIPVSKARVIMLGENHEDKEAHKLEFDILKKLSETQDRKTGLSLEFYDRESQNVLNEYLGGLIDLETFVNDARPPANYLDYQPLIDYCKVESLPVLSSNCPRRYTRKGFTIQFIKQYNS